LYISVFFIESAILILKLAHYVKRHSYAKNGTAEAMPFSIELLYQAKSA